MPNPQAHLLDKEMRGIVLKSLRGELARRRLHTITQAAIFILSAIAIALVDLAHTQQLRFWGNAIGLAAQPLWLYSTWCHRQWGMLALTVFYTGIWTTGFLRYY